MRLSLNPCLAALVAGCLVPSNSYALGTRDVNQDAEATARGDAFAATADDPSAIYYNPAGLMQLDGFNVEGGFYGFSIDEQYEPMHTGNGAHPSTAHEPMQVAPQLFLSFHPKAQVYSFGSAFFARLD